MWKDIHGWEPYYEVSDNGDVRSKTTGRLIVGDVNNDGYYRVCLYQKGHTPERQRFFRHRLVAEHFIPNGRGLPEVNHKDCDRSHNSVDNLEWVDRMGNERYSMVLGSIAYRPFMVRFCDGYIKAYDSVSELAEELRVGKSAVKKWLAHASMGYISKGIMSIKYIGEKENVEQNLLWHYDADMAS